MELKRGMGIHFILRMGTVNILIVEFKYEDGKCVLYYEAKIIYIFDGLKAAKASGVPKRKIHIKILMNRERYDPSIHSSY